MCVLRATYSHGLAVLLAVVVGIGRHSSNGVIAIEVGSQPVRSLRLVRTDKHNVSTAVHAYHDDVGHRFVVSDRQNASTLASSNVTKLSIKEASAINAAMKHDRFCEEFCYHLFTIDDEEPTQILRMPCVRGCRRMYSQGSMGACECDPFEPGQDPKGGPLKQGSRGGCYTFPDPGQGFNWHASCKDLYEKDHGFVVDQPGYRTPEEVTGQITNACKVGWQCGSVMSGCAQADTLGAEYPKDLIGEICG